MYVILYLHPTLALIKNLQSDKNYVSEYINFFYSLSNNIIHPLQFHIRQQKKVISQLIYIFSTTTFNLFFAYFQHLSAIRQFSQL